MTSKERTSFFKTLREPILPVFILLFSVLALLSYGPQDTLSLWNLVLLPILLAALLWATHVPSVSPREEKLPFSEIKALGLMFLLAIALRFYKLTSFSTWPTGDEGMDGFFALELFKQWHWDLLFGPSQMPPLFMWGLAGTFKILGVGLPALWLWPALLSVATVAAAWWAARPYGSRLFALTLGFLTALSFWPVFMGRFSHPGMMLPLFSFLTFGFLGRLAKAKDPGSLLRYALGMGIVVGLGFHTFLPWPATALAASLWILWRFRKDPKHFGLPTALYLGAVTLLVLPLVLAMLSRPYGTYMKSLFGSNLLHQAVTSASYVSGLFWQNLVPYFYYGPLRGGLLNPLLGAAFFMGLVDWFKGCRREEKGWVLGGAFLLMLPGFLANNVEFFRISPILPWLYYFITRGFFRLIPTLGGPSRIVFLVLLLAYSSALDYAHFAGPYKARLSDPNQAFSGKTLEYHEAHQALRQISRAKGPGYVLTSLSTTLAPHDQTLAVSTFPFNVALNPALSKDQAAWCAVLTRADFRPNLERRFPEASWSSLAPQNRSKDNPWILLVVPRTSANEKVLTRWIELDRLMQPEIFRLVQSADKVTRLQILDSLLNLPPQAKDDVFLKSCLFLKADLAATLAEDRSGKLASLEQAVQEGIPTAQLYDQVGAYRLAENNPLSAQEAWKQALLLDPKDPVALENLNLFRLNNSPAQAGR